jgi:hypothetical protein
MRSDPPLVGVGRVVGLVAGVAAVVGAVVGTVLIVVLVVVGTVDLVVVGAGTVDGAGVSLVRTGPSIGGVLASVGAGPEVAAGA